MHEGCAPRGAAAISPLYLPYVSPISPLYLPYISPIQVNAKDKSGATALSLAANTGVVDVVRMLLLAEARYRGDTGEI